MARPLYKGSESACHGGNAGLWYDKFCNQWEADGRKLAENGKQSWIKEVTGRDKLVGEKEQLQQAEDRMQQLASRNNGHTLPMKTSGSFVTGLGRSHPVENGFAWHHSLGVPYLPGSSVKGTVRSWAAEWEKKVDDEAITRIFGPRGEAAEFGASQGNVIFLDALPTTPVELKSEIMTPHYGPWYQSGETPGDWHSPVPIPFLAVASQQNFLFAVLPVRKYCSQATADAELACQWLREALECIGTGAKTAVGYGCFSYDASAAARAKQVAEEQQKAATQARQQAELQKIPEEERDIYQLEQGTLKDEQVNTLYQELNKLTPDLRLRAARALKVYWEAEGKWQVKKKQKKQFEKVATVKEILGE